MASLKTEEGASREPEVFDFSYLLELVNESVALLCENLKFVWFNEASKVFFGVEELAGYSLKAFIHGEDFCIFEDAFRMASADCSCTPLTVEYRTWCPARRTENAPIQQYDAGGATAHSDVDCYRWVKSFLCKTERRGRCDVYMVTRSIEESERRESNKSQDKLNAAKLRYIACVAHELRTPVSSFCLTLDLLLYTALSEEQQELVEQAAVAADLMKLTICQTMDISKALTGAKLKPLLVTVNLSKILKRVNLIMLAFDLFYNFVEKFN